ncbi:DNA polymerase I-3'-5' exonuclease and polymerase domains [Enhydrobacter aerosaccus]|uniref:DNA-directed DNA polymerase n=1 Tax=Enhydrobacter aerosaccus TaxID=225324 RepID=A0A1T4RNR6_9HYPH|nr:DNA polymerase [Enhydrobacter aerosaccus]SKA17619.1 DNA polymerase I-3'-5' exonuclease and polymerase domains [Enhydrobacter aerosaccus]
MRRLLFDIETNGLLRDLTKMHCLVIGDEEGNILFDPGGPEADFTEALKALEEADEIIGHNIIRFDIPALKKLYPWWNPKGKVRDTIIYSKVIWPNLKDLDFPNWRAGKIPGQIIGAHRLEAWGLRLGELKDEYEGDPSIENLKERKARKWEAWNPTMHAYMRQDYKTTLAFWNKIKTKLSLVPADVIDLEHNVAEIIFRQEQFGVCFNVEKAQALAAKLTAERAELGQQLQERFPAWHDEEVFVPKVNNKKMGYEKGVPFTKITVTEFSASNRFHIERAFREHLGWEPTEFNEDGTAKTDEETLNLLPYPEAKLVVRYLVLSKLLGYVANGKEAWLRHVTSEGRIHGGVDSVGAHTFRMTHSKPNLGQVPSNDVPYGHECRELFEPPPGWLMTGIDADALEGRVMAHYLSPLDGGEFLKTILEGKKEDGSDLHSLNCARIGRDPKGKYLRGGTMLPGRDTLKEFFYALIYGAGGEQLGVILGVTGPKEKIRGRVVDTTAKAAGSEAERKLLDNFPALKALRESVQKTWSIRKYLIGIDGRRLYPRSRNAALNTLFQSGGAIPMKVALVILDGDLQAAGYVPGVDYEFMLNVHDEWQIAHRPEITEDVRKLGTGAIAKAGEVLKFRCPLVGSASKPGHSWAETH